jgi:hypothetical protein
LEQLREKLEEVANQGRLEEAISTTREGLEGWASSLRACFSTKSDAR